MFKFALTVAAFGIAGVSFAQSPAGDQGSPGTSFNQNQGRTSSPGTGTQGTATNNQSGRTGSERAGVSGQTGQAGQTAGTSQAAGHGHIAGAGRLESHAADCLILKNEEEIQILQFALPKIQDNDLKQAAQKMVQDHQQAITKLQRFAQHDGSQSQTNAGAAGATGAVTASGRTGAAGATGTTSGASGTALTARDAGRPQSRETLRVGTDERGAGATGTAGAASREGTAGMHDGDAHSAMYQIAQREKEECVRLTEQDLGKKEGAKFDKALAGQQCVMHTAMIAHLRALQGHGSSEFGQLLQQLEQTTEQHKQSLDGMMDKLAQNAESGRSRK